MSLHITTVFFSGTYQQIIQVTNKALGSFYYAQDKDAWYKWFGTPVRLRRVSDVYTLETEAQRLALTPTNTINNVQLLEKKMYFIKETGIAWWNETGSENDWVAIGLKVELRDIDEDLIGLVKPGELTYQRGFSKFYSTDKLREAVSMALASASLEHVTAEVLRLDGLINTERDQRVAEIERLEDQIKNNDEAINKKVDDVIERIDDDIAKGREHTQNAIATLRDTVNANHKEFTDFLENEFQKAVDDISGLRNDVDDINYRLKQLRDDFDNHVHEIDDIPGLRDVINDFKDRIEHLESLIDHTHSIDDVDGLCDIINEYKTKLTTLEQNVVDINIAINNLTTIMGDFILEFNRLLEEELRFKLKALSDRLTDHIGSRNTTDLEDQHGIANGIHAGFSQCNFSQDEKDKLKWIDPDGTFTGPGATLVASASILIDSVSKIIVRAGLTGGDVTAPQNSNVLTIVNGAVTTQKIANNAVNSDKILDGSVIESKIATNAVTTIKIMDGAIITNKIQNNAITTDKINDGAVTIAKIADRAVTDDKLAHMPADTFKARRVTTGKPENLTIAEVRAMLNIQDTAYVHPTHPAVTPPASGNVVTGITVNTLGHVTGVTTGPMNISGLMNSSTSITISGNEAQRAALTGDVTASLNNNTVTINSKAVTNSKMADMSFDRIKGRIGTDGEPMDLTVAQVRTMLGFGDEYSHPVQSAQDYTNTGITVFSRIVVNSLGHVTNVETRDLAGSDILTSSTTNTISNNEVRRAALTGDVTAPANSNITTIASKAVSNSKMADMNQNTIKGRSSGNGEPQDLDAAQVRTLLGVEDHPTQAEINHTNTGRTIISGITVNTLGHVTNISTRDLTGANILEDSTTNTISGNQVRRAAYTGGDVTSPANSITLTIANKAVTNPKLADMLADTIKGRRSSDGQPQDLTPVQVRQMINVADGANKYIHPSYLEINSSLQDRTVLSTISVDSYGHLTSIVTRQMRASDIIQNSDRIWVNENKLDLANMPVNTIIGRLPFDPSLFPSPADVPSVGPPQNLTIAQARELLGIEDSSPDNGMVFNCTLGEQIFTAIEAGTYEFEVWGAQGGGFDNRGGLGGYVKARLTCPANSQLYCYVGQMPQTRRGGYPGGGSGGTGIDMYGGGGMSYVNVSSANSFIIGYEAGLSLGPSGTMGSKDFEIGTASSNTVSVNFDVPSEMHLNSCINMRIRINGVDATIGTITNINTGATQNVNGSVINTTVAPSNTSVKLRWDAIVNLGDKISIFAETVSTGHNSSYTYKDGTSISGSILIMTLQEVTGIRLSGGSSGTFTPSAPPAIVAAGGGGQGGILDGRPSGVGNSTTLFTGESQTGSNGAGGGSGYRGGVAGTNILQAGGGTNYVHTAGFGPQGITIQNLIQEDGIREGHGLIKITKVS